MTDIVERWRHEGKLVRYASGIGPLDDLFRSATMPMPRRSYLIGAPGAGKTYLQTWLLRHFALNGFCVGVMSIDENADDTLRRFAQMQGFTRDQLDDREPRTLDEVEASLQDLGVVLYDHEWTIERAAEDLAARAQKRNQPALLGIDSIHTATCDQGSNAKTTREFVEANLKALRRANEKYKMTILGTAEMNRAGYANSEQAKNQDAKAGGAETRLFEYSAQTLLHLTTPKDHPHIIHVRVPKNRGELTGEFWLELTHELHELTSCSDPSSSPQVVSTLNQQKLDAAIRLAELMLTMGPSSKRQVYSSANLQLTYGSKSMGRMVVERVASHAKWRAFGRSCLVHSQREHGLQRGSAAGGN